MSDEILKLMTGVRIPKAAFLPGLLYLAVQGEIPYVWRLPWEDRIRLAREAASEVTEKGDILQYGGGKKGEVAKAFAAMARGIAAAAFVPGGIRFLGEHYQACEGCGRCYAEEQEDLPASDPERTRRGRLKSCPNCGYDLTQPSKEKEAP